MVILLDIFPKMSQNPRMPSIWQIATDLLAVIFPSSCLMCKEITSEDGLCEKCWPSVELLDHPACQRCFFQFPFELDGLCKKCEASKSYCDSIRSPLRYTEELTGVFVAFKNQNQLHISKTLASMILRLVETESFDCIVAVPLHPLRRIWRGYNQSEVLATELARRTDKPNLSAFLPRNRFTQSQGNFGKADRAKNIKGAFSVRGSADVFAEKRILLVDDVCTTGATLEECARALKGAGAKEVHAVTGAMR